MNYDSQKAYALLQKQHEKEWKQLLAVGIQEEKIKELFEQDIQQQKKDKAFYRHLDVYSESCEGTVSDDDAIFGEINWLAQIENPILYEALMSLTEKEQEILQLHMDKAMSFRCVSEFLGKSENTIKALYFRSIKKIKKFF